MANSSPKLIILFLTTITIFSISPISNALSNCLLTPDLDLRTDPDAIAAASTDYGNLVKRSPRAVLYPSSENDVVELVRLSNECPTPFGIAARGHGHSVRGQAAAHGGVVVDMASLGRDGGRIRVSWEEGLGYYADVGGEQLWIDVLRAGLEHGLAPVSWTDYLYLTVGGTLSNAGISGQSSFYGPQISNVLQLDVITGKGDLVSCSEEMNSELFFAVLGGLGQFGIITRARIVLHKAPTTAKWVRLIYDDFSKFTSDQEHLIMNGFGNGPNYLEGSIITDKSPPNNWRSTSFYSPCHQTKIQSLLKANGGILYSLEFVKYYTNIHEEEVELMMLKDLRFVPGFSFKKDVPLFDFLNRVGSLELEGDNEEEKEEEEEEEEEAAHPWLNLFLPKSQIMDFHAAVILNLIHTQNQTSGPILFYPLNRQKWDDRTSAVVPEDEDIFYTLGLLHSTKFSESHVFEKVNKQILEVCQREGIRIKQYLPHYESKEDWVQHYGSKWNTIQERKQKYDPRMILSPGQRIFTPVMESDF
ncbi:cytokinin dehydrogenase 2-like [Salvia hispanica]|uniref:cytokinin dehydrogenase 2-like n=1 Tax=Salvia hispanica TaxID=49212 RepID=UPI002009C8EC|nr:cytokinin dehydrogenase 2-like [Salvia hispanica]